MLEGSGEVAQRATLLGPKPSIFLLFSFLVLLLEEKVFFLLKKPFLFIGQCLPLFLPSFLFNIPFSLSLSLSLSCYFLSSFLFSFSCFFIFVSLFLCRVSLLLFHEKNNIEILKIQSIPFCFFGLLSCFLFQIPFSSLLLFLILSCLCCSTSMFLSKKTSKQKLVKRGVATKRFLFLTICVLQNVKSCLLGGHFCQNLVHAPKNIVKKCISAHFENKEKKNTWGVITWSKRPSRCYHLVQVWCFLKMVNLDQKITPEMFARDFLFQKKGWTPIHKAFWQTMLKNKANLDQILTPEKAKLGPDNNFTIHTHTHIYIYIYIYPGELPH